MSQGIFNLQLMGRFGNTMFQVAFALACCQRHDLELRIEGDWIGEEIFGLKLGRFGERFPDRLRNEDTLDPNGEADVEFRGYCQNQKSLIYTRSEAREWFKITQPYKERLADHLRGLPVVLWHYRDGDFRGYNYPVVGLRSFVNATRELLPGCESYGIVSEEIPRKAPSLPDQLAFLPDFYRLMNAPILFRSNSSFSYWAAVLGDRNTIFAPIIEGLEGGKEHDRVQFVVGNYPRLSTHTFCTDLHLKP